jgi:alpha-glucosidase
MTTRRELLALAMTIPTATRHGTKAEPASLGLRSPNGRIEVTVEFDAAGALTYGIALDRKPLIAPSPLGLRLAEARVLSQGLRLTGAARTSADRRYTFVVGKTRSARDHYNELTLDFDGPERHTLQLMFRAYDDGIAFRYRIPRQHSHEPIAVEDELTSFAFPGDCACWALNLGTFGTGHEGEFRRMAASAIGEGDLLDVPLVCRTETAVFAIAQADLNDYAGLYLRGRSDGGPGVQVRLSPRLDDPTIAIRARPDADLVSPWRVVMIADRPGDLIQSTLIANLNPPCMIEDTSWIKPGKYAWDWWSDRIVSGVAQPRMDNATMQRFIDFAATTGLQYMVIDAGWYVSGADGEGGQSADATRSIPEIDLPSLVRYADQRGVGLFVWVHWKALDARMEKALELYQRLGLKGIKVDFMDRDDQEMVGFYHRLLAEAAGRRLLVDLHGAYAPTGLSRTYPNLLTQEGVMGAEYNKWSARVTATHNVTLAFTRMLLGPMDYTPGGFRNVRPQEFVARNTLPLVQTTRGQALAMYVVYDSPFVSLADTPDAYDGQAGMDFLSAVPTTWDETRVLAGEIGEFIVIARRSGRDWFIGAMTNETGRTLEVPLAFLGSARCIATIYADGDTPTALAISEQVVDRRSTIALRLAACGGGAIALKTVRRTSRPHAASPPPSPRS